MDVQDCPMPRPKDESGTPIPLLRLPSGVKAVLQCILAAAVGTVSAPSRCW